MKTVHATNCVGHPPWDYDHPQHGFPGHANPKSLSYRLKAVCSHAHLKLWLEIAYPSSPLKK